tara:strand:+ start:808 stop:1266 length:459 start_codon:yes stop_codon:yes gene_type:complete
LPEQLTLEWVKVVVLPLVLADTLGAPGALKPRTVVATVPRVTEPLVAELTTHRAIIWNPYWYPCAVPLLRVFVDDHDDHDDQLPMVLVFVARVRILYCGEPCAQLAEAVPTAFVPLIAAAMELFVGLEGVVSVLRTVDHGPLLPDHTARTRR